MFIIKPEKAYYNSESQRLSFRPLNEDHISKWGSFFINNETERFLGFEGSTKTNEEKARFWIEKQITRKNNYEFGQLAIIEKKTGVFIGVGGVIYREINGKPEYEITYSLLKEHWGQGYGTELALYFQNLMLNTYKVESIISIIHEENKASINVAEKNELVFDSKMEFLKMPMLVYRSLKNRS